jgi:hypothetical protein
VSIQGWLRSGGRGVTRNIEFWYAPHTHGAISCKLWESFDGGSCSSTGAGTQDGDAFIEALKRFPRQQIGER